MSPKDVERDVKVNSHDQRADHIAAYTANDKNREKPYEVVTRRYFRDVPFRAYPKAEQIREPSEQKRSVQMCHTVNRSCDPFVSLALGIGEEYEAEQQEYDHEYHQRLFDHPI